MEAMSPTFSARVAADIISFACLHGADRGSLIGSLGLQQSYLNREDIRIPCETMARMWNAAIEQTGDELLALHLGEARSLGRQPNDVIDYGVKRHGAGSVRTGC